MSATVLPPLPEKLRRRTKLAYGAGDLGPAIVATVNGFFLNAFLIEVAGLPPQMAAIIFLVVKVWDSVNDPLIGTLSDRTNTRWGRRRPWLLFGAVPFALAFFLQWIVPDLSDWGLFWYYLVVAVLLDTGFTAVNVPYTAMTPELTSNYDERTNLNAYRFSFSVLGGTVAAFLHTVIVGSFSGPAVLRGYLISAAIWAVVIVLSNIVTFAFTREHYFKEQPGETTGFWAGVRIALSNRAFIYATLIYLLSWLAIQFVQSNLILYVKYWTLAEDQFQWLLLILQVSIFIFLLIWTRISQRIGKKRTYYVGTSFWIVAGILIFLVPAGNATLLYVLAPLAAVGVSVCYLIPWSILPDVVDLDELESGQRREGVYYGFFVFLQKLGISLGLAFSNLVLAWTGYVSPPYAGAPLLENQPEAVLVALRAFVGLAPVAILLASYVVLYRYPISRERHAEIIAELEARRGQS